MELKFNYFIDWYNESLRSNCTFMELKYVFTILERLTKCSSNCTFMELKLAIILRADALLRVQIVPLWN